MSDIFGDNTIVPGENEVTVSLDDLVGEGKKYKDATELAKAYHHADALIAANKAEKAERDAELKVLRDLVEARSNQQQTPLTEQPKLAEQTPAPKTPDPKVEVDLSKLVREEMASAQEAATKANNVNRVAEQLNSHYGSAAKAQEAVRAKATELGVTVEFLQDVASRSPAAFFSTVGLNPTTPRSTPGYNNEVVLDRPRTDVKNFAYYENLRKSSPKVFYSAEVRKQMFDSARELGDRFYAT